MLKRTRFDLESSAFENHQHEIEEDTINLEVLEILKNCVCRQCHEKPNKKMKSNPKNCFVFSTKIYPPHSSGVYSFDPPKMLQLCTVGMLQFQSFGSNEFGQLGMFSTTFPPNSFTNSILQSIIQIVCIGNLSALLSKDGNVYLVGSSKNSKYKDMGFGCDILGSELVRLDPKVFDYHKVIHILASGDEEGCFVVFLTEVGLSYGCGRADVYHLNNGANLKIVNDHLDGAPVTIIPKITKATYGNLDKYFLTHMVFGVQISCCITSTKQILILGRPLLGDGAALLHLPCEFDQVQKISCSFAAVFVLTKHGQLFVLGDNIAGECATGNSEDVSEFTLIQPRLMKKNEYFVDVVCWATCSTFLTNMGRVFVCGTNKYSCLGLDLPTEGDVAFAIVESIDQPSLIDPAVFGNQKVVKIFCGFYRRFFVTEDGRIFACGNNENQACGVSNSKTVNIASPVCIDWLSKDVEVYEISSGEKHTVITLVNKNLQVILQQNLFVACKIGLFCDVQVFL